MKDDDDDTATTITTELKQRRRRRLLRSPPEVMSPVGGWPQLHAAVGNGADSIYLGLSSFSARARAANFDPVTELPKAVSVCHAANVKVYVAINTLIFDHELEEVEDLVRDCVRAGVDALIVQDLGLAKVVAATYSNDVLELHASTQQTITSADGARFSSEVLETSRIVLGRELSVAEINAVSYELNDDIELETFVHGALCVSYSGQCFSSEFAGGRSANRGQCAQACRLPYGLIDDGQLTELGDFDYLLSPQDLCGIDHVPQLLASHVRCLKIEGRLKDASYVAATTRAYRNAVDIAWDEYTKKHNINPNKKQRRSLPTKEAVSKEELAQLFSRGQDAENNGLSPGFFDGSFHQRLVRGRSPRHRGIHVGRVGKGSTWKRGLVIVTTDKSELKLGDGIVVDRGRAQEDELGGTIYDLSYIDPKHDDDGEGKVVAVIRFSKDVERKWRRQQQHQNAASFLAPEGAHVWKTSDTKVDKKMKRLIESPSPRKSATVSVSGSLGSPLRVIIEEEGGLVGVGMTPGSLTVAEKNDLSFKSVQKAVGMLGNTPWTTALEASDIDIEKGAWCPASWIKEARRQAVTDLELKVNQDEGIKTESLSADLNLRKNVTTILLNQMQQETQQNNANSKKNGTVTLSVLARNYDQVEALCQLVERQNMKIDEIIIDFLEVNGMQKAVSRIRQIPTIRAVVASPRIIKQEESGIWRTLLRLEADALLVRSTGLLYRMKKLSAKRKIPELIGDFSLNVANSLTARELLQYGCSRVTASHDLSADGITRLLSRCSPQTIEVIVHTHMPTFHTEHCVFSRFLSPGNSYLDCGHACTRHDNVRLRDQTGADHLVLADMGCRNTVFSAQAQSGVHSIREWTHKAAAAFRIELVDESPKDVETIVRGYLDVMDGKLKPNVLYETLGNICDRNGRKMGVSFGSLRNGVERRAGEVLP